MLPYSHVVAYVTIFSGQLHHRYIHDREYARMHACMHAGMHMHSAPVAAKGSLQGPRPPACSTSRTSALTLLIMVQPTPPLWMRKLPHAALVRIAHLVVTLASSDLNAWVPGTVRLHCWACSAVV
jgi:hypothetical protein